MLKIRKNRFSLDRTLELLKWEERKKNETMLLKVERPRPEDRNRAIRPNFSICREGLLDKFRQAAKSKGDCLYSPISGHCRGSNLRLGHRLFNCATYISWEKGACRVSVLYAPRDSAGVCLVCQWYNGQLPS